MRQILIMLQTCVLLASAVSVSRALPRFALMTGVRCGSCHVNPTGGQMRTEYGLAYGMEKIPLETLRDTDFSFDPKLSDNIAIGADYRTQYIYDQATKNNGFHAMTASIYGSALLGRKITFFFRQDLINPGYGVYRGTEVYGLFRILPHNWYIKGGDFLPDFGWKLDDHTSYTRGGNLGRVKGLEIFDLLFVPNYKDVGAEVGGTLGPLSLTGGLFNGDGNESYISLTKEKALVGKAEWIDSLGGINYRLGASWYAYANTHMEALTVGFGTGDFALLGELDWHQRHDFAIRNGDFIVDTLLGETRALGAYLELDYRVLQGVWLTGKFDMFDPVQGVADDDATPKINSVQRLTFGGEFFPYSFVELRPQFRMNLEKPSVSDNNEFLAQIHLWF